MAPHSRAPLRGTDILITRPAGTGQALARKVRALGGRPHLLPGLSLRALPQEPARADLHAGLKDHVVIFTSPAAVRFAARLAPLATRARVLAVGRGTLRALRNAGVRDAQAPAHDQQHSEGLLAHPWLQALEGRHVALVTAPGGRGVLAAQLRRRGAQVRNVHVYARARPRLTRAHHAMLAKLGPRAWMLLTSGQALENLLDVLPDVPRGHLLACGAVVSSSRLQALASAAGVRGPVVQAVSAQAGDLLDAVARATMPA